MSTTDEAIVLRGVTWGHTRGLLPVIGASSAWADRTADRVAVIWEARSLWDFGEGDLTSIAQQYDLMVIDHPLVGDAVSQGLLVDLAGDAAFVAEAHADSVGDSQRTYCADGAVWALPVDAACQVAAWRPDLFENVGVAVPTTLAEVHALPVALPIAMAAAPVDVWCMWLALCIGAGEEPLRSEGRAVTREVATAAYDELERLVQRAGPEWLGRNPIDVLRMLSSGDRAAYIPFVFGYSNYSRPGYSRNLLRFGPSPSSSRTPATTVLGGAGVAVSGVSPHREDAIDLARWLASKECQSGPYLEAGGQPGRLSAWRSPLGQMLAGTYFSDTEAALQRAYHRPISVGMRRFQTLAGDRLLAALRAHERPDAVIDDIDRWWATVGSPAGDRPLE
ncbi:ABC transporter substrate-binding protein [Nakamurella antarctica]|nr:ABC transporter substrate-binding protein [Nakamurella antarctica]